MPLLGVDFMTLATFLTLSRSSLVRMQFGDCWIFKRVQMTRMMKSKSLSRSIRRKEAGPQSLTTAKSISSNCTLKKRRK